MIERPGPVEGAEGPPGADEARAGVRVCVVGRPGAQWVLPHGVDVRALLLSHGWAAAAPVGARRTAQGELLVELTAEPATAIPLSVPAPRRDTGLVLAPGEQAYQHQRLAAYAVVRSARGVLLTQLSSSTSAAGRWNLPGGGLDPGEEPVDGLHREVWEETGQRVESPQLADVVTGHWVGRAPDERVEDFHAVRLIYTATCPVPTDPVVHDVGGSTADARWVPEVELARMPLAGFVGELLRDGRTRVGELRG